MKSKALLLLTIPFLIGCTSNDKYTGPKITLAYAEEGKIVDSSVQEMKTIAFVNKVDSIFYLGDDTCASCAEFKPKLVSWCAQNHANIYYIKVAEMTKEDSEMLTDLTIGSYYEWKDKNSIPSTYFMMQGEVVFCGDGSNTMNYLSKYVTVATA